MLLTVEIRYGDDENPLWQAASPSERVNDCAFGLLSDIIGPYKYWCQKIWVTTYPAGQFGRSYAAITFRGDEDIVLKLSDEISQIPELLVTKLA